ncbi:MAG: ATP-dependent zinc protease family protein [Solirubrobacterales bacterium]
MSAAAPTPPVIGWREWIALPDLSGLPIKAKVDTGARTSALHAFDLQELSVNDRPWLGFSFHPRQGTSDPQVRARAPIVDRREITPSSGLAELRYVVSTTVEVNGEPFAIELSLSNRDQMGFRMLLGRTALRGRFLIDPKRSYRSLESKEIKRLARKEAATR